MLSLQAGISGHAVGSLQVSEDVGHPVLLCLLGDFRLLTNGQLVAVRRGGKTEGLLAHLGLAGRYGVPRDVLLRDIWPHSDTALAAQALNSLVHSHSFARQDFDASCCTRAVDHAWHPP